MSLRKMSQLLSLVIEMKMKAMMNRKQLVIRPSRAALLGLGLLISGVGCGKSQGSTESNPAPSAEAPGQGNLDVFRAGWLKRWEQLPPPQPCAQAASEEQALCDLALKERDLLKQAEEKQVSGEKHMDLAAALAKAAAQAGTQLELRYLQRLVLNSQPNTAPSGSSAEAKAAPSASAAPKAPGQGDHAGHDHAGHDHAGHDHAGHDHGMIPGLGAPGGSAAPAPNKGSIKGLIEQAKHGESVEKDPLQLSSMQYFQAEREGLLRIAGYLRAGTPAEQAHALKLFDAHADAFPKSQRASQLLNEAIVLVSDKELREQIRKIRLKLGPGAVPAPSASEAQPKR